MAESLCQLKKKGGGKLKDTVLWTNSTPTSSFNSQTSVLSDSIANYTYIKIVHRKSTTDGNTTSVYIDPSDFSTNVNARNAIGWLVGSYAYQRTFSYNTDLKINFNVCYQSGTTTAANQNAIPVSIIGLK